MTLTPISSLESARKKFLMNSTYIYFWAEMTLTPISSVESKKIFHELRGTLTRTGIGEKKIFHELDVRPK